MIWRHISCAESKIIVFSDEAWKGNRLRYLTIELVVQELFQSRSVSSRSDERGEGFQPGVEFARLSVGVPAYSSDFESVELSHWRGVIRGSLDSYVWSENGGLGRLSEEVNQVLLMDVRLYRRVEVTV